MGMRAIADIWPLTATQQGMLFHAEYDPETTDVYRGQGWLELAGPLDLDALRAAFRKVTLRHASLRAGFGTLDTGETVQVVLRDVAAPWTELDLPGADRAAVEAATRREWLRRFDLTRPPLLRVLVLRLGEDLHRVVLTLHHLICDGWSLHLLFEEWLALYESGGDDSSLPPATPFSEYLAWLAGQDRQAAAAAWRSALSGAEPTLVAPGKGTGAPTDPVRLSLPLSPALTAASRRQARRLGVTPSTLVRGAWGILLGRLHGRADVVFGTTASSRPPDVPGIDRGVGMFLTTLPVRVRWAEDESLARLLGRLLDEQTAMLPHEHLSLTEVRQLVETRGLFDTLTDFQSSPATVGGFDPDAARTLRDGVRVLATGGRSAAHYPLVLSATAVDVQLTYRPDLFDRDEVETLAARLVRVLEGVAGDASLPVAEIDVLLPGERERLTAGAAAVLPAAEGEAADDAAADTVLDAFDRVVARHRDREAVVSRDTSLTYGELDGRANAFAHVLASLGVTAGDLVAVALPRSAELLVVFLGIAKAGAAFVPVDPNEPADRADALLADAAPTLVVTEDVLRRAAAGTADPAPPPSVRVTADSAFYVMYTSGSTGTPKGVTATHGGVAALAADPCWGGVPTGRTLFHAPHTFDAATLEIWVPLLNGGTVAVAPAGVVGPVELPALVADLGLTAVHLTAGVFRVVAQENPACLAGLRHVLTGGDVVPVRAVAQVAEACPEVEIRHLYGPTETTLCATVHTRPPGTPGPWDVLPLGSPRAGFGLHVLDHRLRPVPPAVPGELYVTGPGVARGYLGRPGLTAERFVANPFAPATSTPSQAARAWGRMYRTGDRVRRTADGDLVFLGRADDQVKIRGHRVEPGEVAAVLGRCPTVAQAAVAVGTAPDGGRRLVAYVVPESPGTPGDEVAGEVAETARRYAAERLPDFMVPTAFVPLDAMPLTPNGKVDHAALPAPDLAGGSAGREPRTRTEAALCALFAEVLGRERTGAEDDFFDLGGDSLLAMRVVARVQADLDAGISIREFFAEPTAAGLARRIEAAGRGPRTALRPEPRPERVPLSFAQRRMWFLNQLDADRPDGAAAAYHLPLPLRVSGPLDVAALRAALGDVADRHEALRTVHPAVDGTPYQRILTGEAGRPGLVVRDVPDEDELPGLLAELSGRAFDVRVDLPWRVWLLRLAPADAVLLLVMHHIASDGRSLDVVTRDLTTAYAARRAGRAPAWPPLDVQYADFALWQRRVLGEWHEPDGLAGAQVAYWRTALAGLAPETRLPRDRPRPAVASFRGAAVPATVDAGTHARLVRLAAERRATVFMVVHAALAVTLARTGAGRDVPIGTAIAGRGEARLEELVGFFANTLVLRADLRGDPTFIEVLRRVRETDLAAYAHQDVPFERLVEVLNPARSLSRNPLFQVMLAVRSTPDARWELPGLTVSPVRSPTPPPARFDLSVELVERHDPDGTPAGLEGGVVYAADLFEAATARALTDRLTRVLEQVARDPGLRLSGIDVLDGAERALLVSGGNATPSPASPGPPETWLELFRARVEASPAAVAVRCGAETVTYAQLEERADRLSRFLTGLGVGRETRVGLCLPRGVGMISAMLAVLGAGGAFVPLDPDHPAERLDLMVADSGVAVVLGAGGLPRLPSRVRAVTLVDAEHAAARVPSGDTRGPDGPTGAPPGGTILPDQLAYAIYTSGSTGRPKGVAVSHRGLVNLARAMRPVLDVREGVTALQFASFSFDAAVLDVVTTLAAGGTLAIAVGAERTEPEALAGLIRAAGVTVASVVPSLLGVLDPESVPGVSTWVLGAERLSAGLASRWTPRARVWNTYGPTEATVITTAAPVDPGITPEDAPPSIGRPIGAMRVFVLDDVLQPAPVGTVGEVYITGPGLARGYVDQPGATAGRFVACPFVEGGRMYRSGDLARWTAEGRLDFAGRADDQVKVRGFRIEPGEVEAVLVAHPAVAQAAATVRETRHGDRRLIGYVVPAGDGVDPAAVRDFAAARLPAYLVPARVVALPALPLTPNGKIDRAALPDPATATRETGSETAGADEPADDVEAAVRGLFAEVLGVTRVAADADFFDSGGDSLLAVTLTARLRDELGVPLSVRDLFAAPTPRGAARTVRTRAPRAGALPAPRRGDRTGRHPDDLAVLIPLRPAGDRAPLFCFHHSTGLSWGYSALLPHLPPDQPVYGLQARGLAGPEFLPDGIPAMAADYADRIGELRATGPHHLLGWSLGGVLAHAVATELQGRGQEVGLLALLDAFPPRPSSEPLTDIPEDLPEDLPEDFDWGDGERDEHAEDDPFQQRTRTVTRHTARLLRRHTPRRFHGGLLLFLATEDRPAELPLARARTLWSPFVAGDIETHEVAVDHAGMLHPDPVARIGRLVTRRLQALPDASAATTRRPARP
ncbi:amino acid adenylation domain-containing protein [Streptomyces sp. B6B3]|uniref:amino acid adenylation domain-containing protein n=1 Tax=Streptomyces sp. B6B3 TaxID=3153570 RepID=UPI00325D1C56